jgi:hypothetical protein
MHENHIVLIGSHTPWSGATTFGTGFLVHVQARLSVVTCLHVIREASHGGLFAIPKPKQTKNPPGGYSVLQLGRPRFHPNDGACTYDIAVADVLNADHATLLAVGITPIAISENETVSAFGDGTRLRAFGYPIEYANAALAANLNEPLVPYEIEGAYRPISLNGISQHGFDAPLCEAFIAEAARGAGKGMSGGIVYSSDGQFSGVVLASGEFQSSPSSPVLEHFHGFVFASARRIRETLRG